MVKKKLNWRQRRFVCEYLKDLNATQAAIRAGYSKRTARSQGQRLLTNVDIQTAIEKREAELLKQAEIRQHQVIIEEKYIAFSDIRDFFTKDGVLLMPYELPEHAARALASVEVIKLPGGGTKYKYKLNDKGRSLERLSRHLGLYNDRLQIGVSLEHVLQALPSEFRDEVRKELARLVPNK